MRGIDATAAARIKAGAAARGLTIGAYLAQLVALHDAMRALADAGQDRCFAVECPAVAGLRAELTALGLQTVTA